MWAAAEKHAAAAQALIDDGADLGARAEAGMTALLFAARAGDTDTVRTLLEGGADIDEAAEDAIKPRPRQTAATDAQSPATEPGSSRLGSSVLATAIANAHYDLAGWLVDQSADISVDGPRGTALHGVVRSRNCVRTALPCPTHTSTLDTLVLAEMLLTHGADVNARMTAKPPTKGHL